MSGPSAAVPFDEHRVSVDGFDVRYLTAGDGPTLCFVHGAIGLRLIRAHELLAATHRIVALEIPGFGDSPPNERSRSLRELAGTVRQAIAAIGIDRTSLWGTSFGGKLALWLAADAPDLVDALVLESPAAIRHEAPQPAAPSGPPSLSELTALLYAHPERRLAADDLAPEVVAKQQALAGRLVGPARDAELESAMAGLDVPTLALFGTADRLTPPELGRHYRRILPDCHVLVVYDAAHQIASDRPEAFASVVADFVERRAQFVVRTDSGLRHP